MNLDFFLAVISTEIQLLMCFSFKIHVWEQKIVWTRAARHIVAWREREREKQNHVFIPLSH